MRTDGQYHGQDPEEVPCQHILALGQDALQNIHQERKDHHVQHLTAQHREVKLHDVIQVQVISLYGNKGQGRENEVQLGNKT